MSAPNAMDSANRIHGTPRGQSPKTDTPIPGNDFGVAGDLDDLEELPVPIQSDRQSENEEEAASNHTKGITSLVPARDIVDGLVTSSPMRTLSPFEKIPPFSPQAYRVYTLEYQDQNFQEWATAGWKKVRRNPKPMEVVREETPTPADVLLGDIMFRREKIAGLSQRNLENLIRDIHHVISRKETGFMDIDRLCMLLHSTSAIADTEECCPCEFVMAKACHFYETSCRRISQLEERLVSQEEHCSLQEKEQSGEVTKMRGKVKELQEIVESKEKLCHLLKEQQAQKTTELICEQASLKEKLAAREKQCLQLSNQLTLLMSENTDSESNIKQEYLELLLSIDNCQKEKQRLEQEVVSSRKNAVDTENKLENDTQTLTKQLLDQQLRHCELERLQNVLKDKYDDTIKKIDVLTEHNAEFSKMSNDLKKENDSLLSDNKILCSNNMQLDKRLDELSHQRAVCETQICQLKLEIDNFVKDAKVAREAYFTKCELLQKEKFDMEAIVQKTQKELTSTKGVMMKENKAHVMEMESLKTNQESNMWEMEQEITKHKDELCSLQKLLEDTNTQVTVLTNAKKQIRSELNVNQLENRNKIKQLENALQSLKEELNSEKENGRKVIIDRDHLQQLINDMEVQPSRCQRPLEELVSLKNYYQQEAAQFKSAHEVRRKEEEKRVLQFKKQMKSMTMVMEEQEGLFEKERKELQKQLKSLQRQSDQDIARWDVELTDSSKMIENLYKTVKEQRQELAIYREEHRLQNLADFRKSHSLDQGLTLKKQRSRNKANKTQTKINSDSILKYHKGGVEIVETMSTDKSKKKTCSGGAVRHGSQQDAEKGTNTTMSTQDVTCDVKNSQTIRAFSAFPGQRRISDIAKPTNHITKDEGDLLAIASSKNLINNHKTNLERKKRKQMSAIYGPSSRPDPDSKSKSHTPKVIVPQPPATPNSGATYVRKVRNKGISSAGQTVPSQMKKPRLLPPVTTTVDKRDAYMQF